MIADTDKNYIHTIQLKFIEEFFDEIDLEIITDKEYFEALFTMPQKADILIVSVDLYDVSIQKHNIDHVFLMTEEYEEEQTADLSVNKIFKYTSLKEIFNEIVGKSSETLNIDNTVKKEPQIIVVTSAAGGAGKTTAAMGLSACLAKSYKKVLYINTDELQTFQYLLQNQSPISNTEVYSKLMQAGESIYRGIKHVIRKELFSYLPPFKAALMSLGLTAEVFEDIVKAAKKSNDYEFIVVDTDSTFNKGKAALLDLADKVIFVTRQNSASVISTNILVTNINGMNTEKYSFICNDYNKELDNALISPNIALKFGINEYIEHFSNYDLMKCTDFAEQVSFQRAAYLLI